MKKLLLGALLLLSISVFGQNSKDKILINNPIKDSLIIEDNFDVKSITIFDLHGKVVYKNSTNTSKKINLKSLNSGIYVINYCYIDSSNVEQRIINENGFALAGFDYNNKLDFVEGNAFDFALEHLKFNNNSTLVLISYIDYKNKMFENKEIVNKRFEIIKKFFDEKNTINIKTEIRLTKNKQFDLNFVFFEICECVTYKIIKE